MAGERTGETIGKWQLGQLLGSGGMGEVYLGSRIDGEVRHTAAIKILHAIEEPGLAAEQAALRAVHHHGVAALLEDGLTLDGRRYLVLEYVNGVPITGYADQRGFTVEERLGLFLEVCAAVRAIHEAQWLHMDLKPGNILVNRQGRVKVVDFGLARRPGAEPAELQHAFSGPYASPEQVVGEKAGRAADLYSLCVVLYELLCGHPPFDAQLSEAELQRRIREETPPPPSAACSRSKLVRLAGGRSAELDAGRIAAMRSCTGSGELRRALKGHLDAICLFALRKEPSRRYRYAEDLARDLDSVLQGKRPPFARSGDPFYSGVRAARRRPLIVAGIMMAVSATFAGWALPRTFRGATVAALDARRQADRAADGTVNELQTQLRPALAALPRLKNSEKLLDAIVRTARPAPPVRTPWEQLQEQLRAWPGLPAGEK